jgi:hypothetical protein
LLRKLREERNNGLQVWAGQRRDDGDRPVHHWPGTCQLVRAGISSAAAFVGPAGVTTTTGFPVVANSPTLIPVTGAENDQLFAVVSTGTATVSYLTIT